MYLKKAGHVLPPVGSRRAEPLPRGRPRSPERHAAILKATAEILGENGYAALTIERVAERAGVARQTIYRRWRSKLELVVELMQQVSESAPLPDCGNLRSDLSSLGRQYAENIATAGGPIVPALIAESLYNPELAVIVRGYIMARRTQAIAIFERAVLRGELQSAANAAAIVDLLSGFSWYRKLIARIPFDAAETEALVDVLLKGMS